MSASYRRELREKQTFSLFAEACKLTIRPDSIENRKPPEPDILCEVEGEGFIAFEMVELIDQNLAQRVHEKIKLQKLFEDAFQNLQVAHRSNIGKRFGNALIHVSFKEEAPSRSRSKSISLVFDLLQEMTTEFVGELRPMGGSILGKVVKKVTVRRGNFSGPCFNIEAGGSFADPTINLLRQKFEKQYKSPFPIELLAYYELQPALPESFWLPEIQAFMIEQLKSSQFGRVWVHDIGTRTVRFNYPNVE